MSGSPMQTDMVVIGSGATGLAAALTAAQAISAALFARERGAGGQHLKIPMLEVMANFVWADAAGNEVLAISHNANLSDGWMYPIDTDSLGRPIDRMHGPPRREARRFS